MSDFPFYDSFNTNIKDKDLTPKQKEDFVKKIKKIDQPGKELLYAIIKVHELKNNSELSSFDLPYSSKYDSDNNLEFDLEIFPFKLKQILNKFLTIHLKKMREDIKNKKK